MSQFPQLHPSKDVALCLISKIVEDMQLFFDETCRVYKSSRISINELLKVEDGSQNRGDFSLFLSPTKYPNLASNLQEIAESLKSRVEYLEHCRVSEFRVVIYLCRAKVYTCVLPLVDRLRESYGYNTSYNSSVLLLLPNSDTSCLTAFRTCVIARHVVGVLLANGFQVHCKEGFLGDTEHLPNRENLISYDCHNCDLELVYADLENRVTKSEFHVDPVEMQKFSSASTDKQVILDGRRYLEKTCKSNEFDKSIGYIHLKNESLTHCLKWCANMTHVLNSHARNVNLVLILTSTNLRYFMQQCLIVHDILSDKVIKKVHMVHHQVFNKNLNNATTKCYMQQRKQEMLQSLVHKHGEDVLNHETWNLVLQMLTETVIQFDFLSTGFTAPLKINSDPKLSKSNDKRSTFVQYNCARISNMLMQFDNDVALGKYESVHNITDLDFSTLSLQEEWELFFNFVVPFPKIISNLGESIKLADSIETGIATQAICLMLTKLSHAVSLYYNKHRVLAEPYPQLLSRMYSRLYLYRAIHQVMKNSLALLNLEAVEKM